MSDSPATGTPPAERPDTTLISPPLAEAATQSALSHPLGQTASGETLSTGPRSTLVDVGSQLGPYKLLAKLGEGGMGAVYQARHTKLGKLVALKILPQHLLSRSDALSRFEREMLAVGSLQHPNIIQALDAGEIGGVHYLSMEYVEGQDLQELIKTQGPLSIVNACKTIRQAAQGLAAAHKLGLVHRDIKPSNLFITKQSGQIKILDMGLALLAQEETPVALTTTGQCFGTPDYMAPEQWNDAHACDARSDLYSLGCTLYFLLAGRPPYHSDTHRSAANKMKGHVMDPVPDLALARHDAPPGLVAIYFKLMAKKPTDRFASADELAAALVPWCKAVPAPSAVVAPPRSPRSAAPKPPKAAAVAAPTARRGPPRRPWSRWRLAAGGAAALILLGVIIITITNKDGTQTKLEVPGDAQQIEVTQAGKTLVKVNPGDPPKPMATTPSAPADLLPIDYAAERKAAEWLAKTIEGKSYCHLLDAQGELVRISPDDRQLPDGDFVVDGFHLEGSDYDDAGFANLAGCRRIRLASVLHNTALTAKGLRHLTSSVTLNHLGIGNCPAIEGALIPLLGTWKELNYLGLVECRLSSEDLLSWPAMPQLISLYLTDVVVNEDGLRSIVRQCPNLEQIHVNN